MIDIISVFCRRDLALQRLQAVSIAKYFERSSLGRVLCIWNDTSETPNGFRRELAETLDGISVEVLDASELGVGHAHAARDGWTAQQALKLLAGRRVRTASYLVLDAKNHFIRPSSVDDFVALDGRGVFPFEDLCKYESFRYCLEYFGIEPGADRCRGVLNVTPFLLRVAVVERLLAALERKERGSVVEAFFKHQHELSEFLAYQAFYLSEGGELADLFQEAATPRAVVLWGSAVREAGEFERSMDLIENEEVKVMSMHWLAYCLSSSEQRARLCDVWLRRGLVMSAKEGHQVIDSVICDLSEGDKKYLQKFLRSVGNGQPAASTAP